MGYRPEFDGLRGLAAGAVVVGHARPSLAVGGLFGVEVFFVLSGFLITTLMLEERAATGSIGLGGFYSRRARRLLPALWVLVAVVGSVSYVVGAHEALRGSVAAFTYSSNLARMAGQDLGPMSHLWSLAVEEHFYLVWPLVMLLLRGRPGRVLVVAAGLAALTYEWRIVVATNGEWFHANIGSDTRAMGILVGAALAAAVKLGLRGRTGLLGTALLAVCVAMPVFQAYPERFGFVAVDLATVLLLLGALNGGARWLRLRPLVWLGGVSYALYLWHAPLMALTHSETGHVIAALASVPTAWASTRFIEARWRKGHHQRPQPARAAREPVAAAD